jgi:hypothetical protein
VTGEFSPEDGVEELVQRRGAVFCGVLIGRQLAVAPSGLEPRTLVRTGALFRDAVASKVELVAPPEVGSGLAL